MTESVLTRIEDGVGIISLNRPERHNALDDEAADRLNEVLRWAFDSNEVRAILIRGEGKSFCSGRDTSMLGHRAQDESDFVFVRHHQDRSLSMLDCPKPIVAAIRGHAIGGGLEIALAADMRIASRDARMMLPEIRYGILPDTGGTQFLAQLIGPSKAKYLVMTGDEVNAERALEWGLVDWVVEPEELDSSALEIAGKLAAGPPLAVSMAKQLIDQLQSEEVRRGVRLELLAQTTLFKSEDYQEARAALREERPPRYQGK